MRYEMIPEAVEIPNLPETPLRFLNKSEYVPALNFNP